MRNDWPARAVCCKGISRPRTSRVGPAPSRQGMMDLGLLQGHLGAPDVESMKDMWSSWTGQ